MKESLGKELRDRVMVALEAKIQEVTVGNADKQFTLKKQAIAAKKKMNKYEGGKNHDKFVDAKEKMDRIIRKLEDMDTHPSEIKRVKNGKM